MTILKKQHFPGQNSYLFGALSTTLNIGSLHHSRTVNVVCVPFIKCNVDVHFGHSKCVTIHKLVTTTTSKEKGWFALRVYYYCVVRYCENRASLIGHHPCLIIWETDIPTQPSLSSKIPLPNRDTLPTLLPTM